jgi:hypothetical protein
MSVKTDANVLRVMFVPHVTHLFPTHARVMYAKKQIKFVKVICNRLKTDEVAT